MTTDTSKLMDGKALAQQVLDRCAAKVEIIKQSTGRTPCLATVLVGSDPASATYVKMKGKRCEAVGMTSLRVEMPQETTTEQLMAKMRELADDDGVNGILLQHPVPSQVDERAAFEAIPVSKDVDGVTAGGLGEMWLGIERFGSCTPAGIMTLLRAYDVNMNGAEAVVIGRSPILGKPMAAMLLNANATVTICHSRTKDLASVVKRADIVVAAVGKANFVQGDWIKDGAVVIDAGYNAGNVGDVDFDAALPKASLITPVPGGVGPMTIATLIDQTADAAALQWNVQL
ncbi:MAG: bifunctional 5,10-methylene-tetrahydrofolate dehydrogenase/5,10-methylene-tetrahydrofolate cyclohydrolase [Phycisphaera sp.]|nr:bifunctional 5,10-methylene-tetrahydrofolate dehydrogenase/5,10-methylene-tetrahydrofolate cyclohydrolase [Phycisphaera sp.]